MISALSHDMPQGVIQLCACLIWPFMKRARAPHLGSSGRCLAKRLHTQAKIRCTQALSGLLRPQLHVYLAGDISTAFSDEVAPYLYEIQSCDVSMNKPQPAIQNKKGERIWRTLLSNTQPYAGFWVVVERWWPASRQQCLAWAASSVRTA